MFVTWIIPDVLSRAEKLYMTVLRSHSLEVMAVIVELVSGSPNCADSWHTIQGRGSDTTEALVTRSMFFGRIIDPVAGVTQPWRDEAISRQLGVGSGDPYLDAGELCLHMFEPNLRSQDT